VLEAEGREFGCEGFVPPLRPFLPEPDFFRVVVRDLSSDMGLKDLFANVANPVVSLLMYYRNRFDQASG